MIPRRLSSSVTVLAVALIAAIPGVLHAAWIDLGGEQPLTVTLLENTTDRTVYEGVIAEEEADKIWLHTAQNKIPIPRNRIVRKDSITVNAVEVYPNTKLYEDRLAEMGQLDVEGHFELGKFCMQIELYEKVIEHFGKVQELDPTFKPDFIQAR